MRFLDPPYNHVWIDANRRGVRARERAPEDTSGPAGQVIRLEALQEGHRKLRLFRDVCQGNAAAFAFTA
jgi:hypothetical protein